MIGMDRRTGRTISGIDQLASRMLQVFTTQAGSRIRRREFGGTVPDALGNLINHENILISKAAMFDALASAKNGMDDFDAKEIQIQPADGGLIVYVSGQWQGTDITVPVPLYD